MSIVLVPDCNQLQELICSLPHINMKNYATVLAIKHPVTGDFVVIKSRLSFLQTIDLTENDFEYPDNESKSADQYYEYLSFLGRNIVLDSSILTDKGKEVLESLEFGEIDGQMTLY